MRVSKLELQMKNVQKDISDNRANITIIKDSQVSMKESQGIIKVDTKYIKKDLSEIKNNHLHNLKKGIEKLDNKFEGVNDKIDGKFDSLDKRVDSVCLNLAQMKPTSDLGRDIIKTALTVLVNVVIMGALIAYVLNQVNK